MIAGNRLFDFFPILLLFRCITWTIQDQDDFAYNSGVKMTPQFSEVKPMRYLLYDVNPGEGFNLRRDVYMRIANLVLYLNKVEPWSLVLPPWGNLYHWRSDVEQSSVPWATFFDLESLSRHVPVLEFHDFVKVLGEDKRIDEVYYLQMYEEGWEGGRWQEKIDVRPCIGQPPFRQDKSGRWTWWYWGYEGVYSNHFVCMSVQSQSTHLVSFLTTNTTGRSVFLVRAEELIHGEFSEWSTLFWTARRSLVFAKHLCAIGDEFRRTELNSTDEQDGTVFDEDWTQMKREHGQAIGGPYLAVHLRRRDFLHGHRKNVPTIPEAAYQIEDVLKELGLTTVFVATDSHDSEFAELKRHLSKYSVKRFVPSEDVLHKYKDGGVAIIDQWICAHARFFIGTCVSTFSFRIHEEREILGFDPKTTFNCFCSGKTRTCKQPTQWLIQYG